ncbi:hypothetical protein ACVBGC_23255 [Burkholderia stagnalis]
MPFALLPSIAHAEAGELGGIAMAALTFSSVVWVVLTLLVFLLLLRRLTPWKRFGLTLLFFFLPVLLLGGELLKEYAFGESTSNRTEITTKPMVVLGVTFPPGSRAEYEQTGGLFGWGATRTLETIHGPRPVLLGKVPIDGLIFIKESCCDQARAEVSAGTIVDGWPCGDAMFDLTPAGPALRSCFLAAPLAWHGKQWPAGSYVDLATPPIGQDTK